MPLDHGPMVNFGHVPLMTSTWLRQKVVPRGEGASPREAWLQFNHWMFESSSLSCGTFIHEVPSFSSAHPHFAGWDKALSLGWGQGDMASSEGSAPPPAATSSHQQLPLQPQHPRGTALCFLDHARMQENISVLLFLMLNGCAQS